jgi:hypothetical protein
MSASIVPQLIKKDFRLMRGTLLVFAILSLVCIGVLAFIHGRMPDWVLYNFGFVLLVSPAGTCGIVLLMKTNVFEKEKSTQPFIMSLPVTVKEFTQAKLLFNLPVFMAFWTAISAAAFYFIFGLGPSLFPLSTMPFVVMIFLGGFVAYACILAVSLVTQSLGITVLSIAVVEMVTSGYLWAIGYLDPVTHHVYGPNIVWSPEAIAIVAAQAAVAVLAIAATLLIQNTKRDFI